jgi:hypothetical protein
MAYGQEALSPVLKIGATSQLLCSNTVKNILPSLLSAIMLSAMMPNVKR